MPNYQKPHYNPKAHPKAQPQKTLSPKSPEPVIPPGFDPQPIVYFENTWTFWFQKEQSGGTFESYQDSLLKLGSFNTIQDFWRWYNNLPPTDSLNMRTGFHLMKGNIAPLWEHEDNLAGGTFSLRVPKEYTTLVWLQLLLATLGEQFDSSLSSGDEICGISVGIRKKQNVVDIWNKDASNFDQEQVLKLVRGLVPEESIENPLYSAHRTQEDFSHTNLKAVS